MGKHNPKMQCRLAITVLSIFGTITIIMLTGVRSRVRGSLYNSITAKLLLLTVYFFF